ncbi:MAG: ribosome small subunit-dependent GTPase A [Bacteroidia bacterium]|nr:ribosome small subunit-dependent GTPase A [Bacteroidia bacterium]
MGGKKGNRTSANAKKGRVIRSVGSSIRVEDEEGQRFDCVIRGKFRIKGIKSTNPVAVGDEVMFVPPQEESELGVITELQERKNYILRKAIGHNHKVHILAANVDQAILVFTIDFPPTSTGFANRFLLVTEAYHIPAVIVINKVDLITNEEQRDRLRLVKEIYSSLGYKVIEINSTDPSYQQTALDLFKGKVSFIGGHSGAGKSTLLNLVDPDLNIKTGLVSDYNKKGKHTTTYAEMHPLAPGGYVIDSPGIKELGLTGFDSEELRHYFPEMRRLMADCRFNDCKHLNEPGCAVRAGLETGEVHPSRYDTYLRMMEEVKELRY